MGRVGAIVRFLLLGACLVPFSSTRQVVAFVPAPPTPAAPAPLPEEEETERGKEPAGKEKARRSAQPSGPKPAVFPARLHPHPTTAPTTPATRSPHPIDPFRNGLGCPFRC